MLLVAGLAVGVAVPFFWASRVPIFLGAALLVAAGLLTRRAGFAVAGIAAAYDGENTFVSSAGDRMILSEGDDEDHLRQHVLAAG